MQSNQPGRYRKTDADGNVVRKPFLIREYNLHMGGVDCVDQQLHNVSPIQKVYQWHKKIAFRIIMQMILNAQKIYVGYTGAKMPFQNSLKTVIERNPQPELIVLDETASPLTVCHFPGLLLSKPDAKDQRPSKTDHGTALKTRYIMPITACFAPRQVF